MALSIEDILRNDPLVREVIADNQWNVPEIDCEVFGENIDSAKVLLSCVIDYLQGPYIIDDFTHHPDRRKWRKEMEQAHSGFNDFYQKNVLKGANHIGTTVNAIELVAMIYQGSNHKVVTEIKDEIIPVRSFVRGVPSQYEGLTIEEKKEYVHQLKQKVQQFLYALAEKPK